MRPRRIASGDANQRSLAFARDLVPVSHSHELPAKQEACVLVGYAVGVLLAHGVPVHEVQAEMMKNVDSALCEAQLGGLVRKPSQDG